jgi:voltage-gated potassium channel
MTRQDAPRTGVRARTYEILERGRRQDTAARLVSGLLALLVVTDVLAIVAGSVPAIAARHGAVLTLVDRACVTVFALEYALRLWTAPEHPALRHLHPTSARRRHAATPMMVVDFVVLLPLLLELLFPAHAATIRLAGLVRFLKLARYTPAMATIGQVIADVRRPLYACIVLFVGLILLAATLMHLVEGQHQPDKLGDIPGAMWWAVATLTRLGYAEIVPVTLPGRLVAATIMLLGIGFFALPLGIIGRGFYDEIRRRDFVITFGMVARVPLFATLDAGTIAELVSLLKASKVGARQVVIHKGDKADAMFFIASGEVEVEVSLGQPKLRLKEGDFFGEMALLERGRRVATVTAVRPTELLVLDASDFERLMQRSAELAHTVKSIAAARKAQQQE